MLIVKPAQFCNVPLILEWTDTTLAWKGQSFGTTLLLIGLKIYESVPMSDEDLTGARVELILSNDVTLTLHRLTDRDISELDLWIRGRVVAIARAAITPDMGISERNELTEAGLAKAMKTSWTSGDGNALMSSVEGIARLLYQADDTDVTYEDIRITLYDTNVLSRVMQAIDEIQPRLPASLDV